VKFGSVVASDLVNEMGMVNDGYDYKKHMKEIGIFLFSNKIYSLTS